MSTRPATSTAHQEIVREAERVIRARLGDRDLAISDVAFELGYCERQLRRILLASGGFREMLRTARMDVAARRLLAGQRVKAVAVAVGYRPAHFAAPFAEVVGLTPTQVRRAGAVCRQLHVLQAHPPHGADLYARCRAVDRWTALWTEALELHRAALAGSVVAETLTSAIASRPPRRPRPVPRGRRRRQAPLQREFMRVAAEGAARRDEAA